MQYHWSYTGCDETQQAEIAELWRTRQDQLDAKAELIGGGLSSQVVVTVERSDASPEWWMHAALYAAEGTSAAEAKAPRLADAMDQVIGNLSQQIDRQSTATPPDQPPADPAASLAQRRRNWARILPVLQSYHRQGKSREFIALLTPVLRSMSRYVRRELRARRAEADVAMGRTTVQEVTDDVLLRAWEQFDRRPPQQSLDVWLIRLIDTAVEQLSQPEAEQSLQDRVPIEQAVHGQTRESQQFEAVEDPTEPDSIALERLIPDRVDAEPWDRWDNDTKQVRLEGLLHRLPRQQRHAIMLQTVDGFSEEEIADLQSRSLADVVADLAAAQQQLHRMMADDIYPEIQERLEREALQRPRRSHRT